MTSWVTTHRSTLRPLPCRMQLIAVLALETQNRRLGLGCDAIFWIIKLNSAHSPGQAGHIPLPLQLPAKKINSTLSIIVTVDYTYGTFINGNHMLSHICSKAMQSTKRTLRWDKVPKAPVILHSGAQSLKVWKSHFPFLFSGIARV